jgi:hypothetical protein
MLSEIEKSSIRFQFADLLNRLKSISGLAANIPLLTWQKYETGSHYAYSQSHQPLQFSLAQ